jgi:hypothetical protein
MEETKPNIIKQQFLYTHRTTPYRIARLLKITTTTSLIREQEKELKQPVKR